MCELRQIQWIISKHVLRYLHGTVGYVLSYDSECDLKLQGFIESVWVGFSTGMKSTSGCCFSLVYAAISWCSRKKNSVALCTIESEYMASSSITRESIWLHKCLAGLFSQILEPTMIHCDN